MPSRGSRLWAAVAAGALAAALACTAGDNHAAEPALATAGSSPGGARRVTVIEGLDGPECVRYDPDQDVYFISNIVGFGSVKDGAAYIVRVPAGDLTAPEIFIRSGENGVTLDAPKGMALQGDTLWVADIDVLRGFDRRTGAPLAAVDLSAHEAVLLNDLTLGPDGALYITDSGLEMTPEGVVYTGGSKIFVVAPDHTVSVLASGEALQHPNGIAWDAANGQWIVASFGQFQGGLYALSRDGAIRREVMPGRGRFDGLAILPDGRILASAWNDSSIHMITRDGGEQIIRGLSQPAAIGVDTRRQRLAIPLVMYNRVEFWELPRR